MKGVGRIHDQSPSPAPALVFFALFSAQVTPGNRVLELELVEDEDEDDEVGTATGGERNESHK